MNLRYDIIFIPDGIDPEQIDDTRSVILESDSRFGSRDNLMQAAQNEAIYTKQIDEYAMRNYWRVACCEMKITESPWDDVNELADYMRSEYDVESILSAQNTWRHESIECNFESPERRKEVEKSIRNDLGSAIPLASKRTNLRVTLRAKANIDLPDFQIAKKVFNKHGMTEE